MLFTGLKDVLRTFDEHGWKGSFTRGLWVIGNGGYDCWFELTYKGLPVVRCIAGELESTSWVSDEEKEKLFGKILEVYDNLKVRGDDFLEGLVQEEADEETIAMWFDALLESVGKSSVEELTQKDLLEEIEEVKGSISNERIWEKGYDGDEHVNPHSENIITLTEYLEELNALFDKVKEKEGSLDDVIKTCSEMSKNGNRDMPDKGGIDKDER